MRELEEIIETTRSGSLFSNGTDFEYWSYSWCDRCVHDEESQSKYCPILTALVLDEGIPTEIGDDKICSEFEEYDE
jgi:hypothetical protein